MTEYLKKIIIYVSVFCIVGMFFTSYSAVVSENDGSTFLTKQEFDALKKSFNSQIDNYNKSIDEKIDGSIASFLAGIQIATKYSYKIPHDWDDVYFMNGYIAPQFRVPEVDAVYSYSAKSASSSNNLKQLIVSGRDKNTFTWSAGQTCRRPLFGLISGSESTMTSSSTKVYWRGIAERYHEKWDLTWSTLDVFSDLAYLDLYPTECGGRINGMFLFNKSGYYSNLASTSFYDPTLTFFYVSSAGGAKQTTTGTHKIFSSQIFPLATLDNNGSGKTTSYDHIVQYNKVTKWCLSNEKFTHTFTNNSLNPYTDTDLYNSKSSVKSGSMYIAGVFNSTGGYYAHGSVASLQYINSGSKLSSIGMIGDKEAGSIYQYDKDKSISVNKKVFNLPNKTLETGFQLCAATAGSIVEWTADFSEVYAYNGSSYVTNNHEVDIYVSYEPFTNLVAAPDLIQFKDSSGVMRDYVTTVGRKASLKWTQNKDSVIYIKCVPHFTGTSYINNDWRVKLNLTGESKNFYINVV